MRAAIYNSLLNLGNTSSTLNLNCPTGNCTFGHANTLGFCSKCEDATQQTTVKCINNKDESTGGTNTNCIYYLPGDIIVSAGNTIVTDNYEKIDNLSFSDQFRRTINMSAAALYCFDVLITNAVSTGDNAVVTPQGEPSITKFLDISVPLLGFGRIVFNNRHLSVPSIGESIMPNATECAMFWCVQTLDTAIQNGILFKILLGPGQTALA